MEDRIVLITGATGGIGKAAATNLAKKGFTVVIHGRDAAKTKAVAQEIKNATGNQRIDMLVADLFSLQEVKEMAERFKHKYHKLDILINNAGGVMGKERRVTKDGLEQTIAVNLLAPFLLTELLLPWLKKSDDARIINVASNAHQLNAKPDFTDLTLEQGYNPLRAYGNSKLFLIWNTQRLAWMLEQQGISHIKVNSVHPGSVATNFAVDSDLGPVLNLLARMLRPFFITPEKGADTILYLATAAAVQQVSGKYFVKRKEAKVSGKYYSAKHEKLVWDWCKDATCAFV